MYRIFFKRVIDIAVSLMLILILLPVFAIVTIVLFVSNRGRPFFFQARPGLGCKEIEIVKFRSMDNSRDSLGNLLPDNERLTPAGAFVRKTSLDELPQLFNVLRGDMSLVGPR